MIVPDCPFCDKELDAPQINGLHARCHRAFNEEMAESFPNDLPHPEDPDDIPFVDVVTSDEALLVF